MQKVSLDRDYAKLEQEIQGNEYEALLKELRESEPFIRRFESWSDVLEFMREGTSDDPLKDEVLRPILTAHAVNKDPRWRAVLLAIFWPGLRNIARKKKHLDASNSDRWQNVVCTFLQLICKFDPAARPKRLVQKVFNDVFHRFHLLCLRSSIRAERETPTNPEELDDRPCKRGNIDFDEIDRNFKHDAEIRRLRKHMEAGRLRKADFMLLVGTRVYGKTAAEYGREVGMSADHARKRRLRAEAAIRVYEKFCPAQRPSTPLLYSEGIN